ncbi:CidA/LrgA family protein [Agathobaculum sp. LCP25S3_E8]|uniref:CidA/LrgA family protein n=1 Tax=Agathobaculum sp. LCP25S3_E8 TaxID=3438735 RepID=UPI003F8F6063
MNYIRQLGVLIACCVAGDALSILLHGALPGNVLGLTLLLLLLIFGPVRMDHVEHSADFLLQNMAFFFLPACLGVLEIFAQIKSEILAMLAVCVLTTLCTAAATALTVHIVFRLQHRESEEAFDHD